MGAPKGNTNALKHGLYAKHFSPEEQTRLRKMSPEDYRHEIAMMRLAVSNLFQIQVQLHKMVEEAYATSNPATWRRCPKSPTA